MKDLYAGHVPYLQENFGGDHYINVFSEMRQSDLISALIKAIGLFGI